MKRPRQSLIRTFGIVILTCLSTLIVVEADVPPWHLPTFPTDPNVLELFSKVDTISRNVWVGMKTKPASHSLLPDHLQKLFKRATGDGWTPEVMGNSEQLAFMEKYYANTSTLWAFKMINPRVANAACDIWRYALLYAIGGLYLDDDSYLESSLNDIVKKEDTLIVTAEKNLYRDNCYVRRFHLNEYQYLRKKYPKYTGYDQIAGNKMLASWGIFSAPGHPIIKETLQNIVEVIRAEYLRRPLVYMMNTEPRWKIVMCATGPTIFSGTIRHHFVIAASNRSTGFKNSPKIRFISNDYKEFGGIFKVDMLHNGHYPVKENHYMVAMAKHSITLLKDYVPFHPEIYENFPVSPGGKRIYLVQNGSVHMFPNYDTITFNGFDMSDVIFIQKWSEFQQFPEGAPLEPCVPNTPNCR